MILRIPILQNASAFTQRVPLDGTDYILDFAWNGRDVAWYLTIRNVDNTALLVGRKLVSNRPLLKRFRYIDGLPAGELMAVDLSGKIDAAGYEELNAAVDLLYFDAAEIEALNA